MLLRFCQAVVLFAVSCTLLIAGATPAPAADAAALAAARNSITAAQLMKHVEALADDSFEGREAGSRGGRAAGVYLMKLLEAYGLKPAGDRGTYFQSFGSGYRNILGLLEGSDPQLKNEVVLVGAHYDHVGYGDRTNSFGPIGYIHNGADDNASGTAALLEAIEAFGMLPAAPRRSVLFVWWDGEEKGLLGSKHWVQQPTMPLERIRFAINIDMIGRVRKKRLEVFGTRTATGLRRLVSEQNQGLDLSIDFSWELKENSDHHPFFAKSIPVLMLHSGLHDDYHRPSDDAHKINAAGMQQTSRLLFNLVNSLADTDTIVGFRAQSRRESPLTQLRFEQPLAPLPARLGVRWKTPAEQETGLELTQVTPGGAAAKAGIQAGDRLMSLASREITDPQQFVADIVTSVSPVEIGLQRAGQDEPLVLKVELAGQPVRLGINWREDAGEPQAVMLTRVVPGSPAARGGLMVRDRIYQVNGRLFSTSDELSELLTSLPSPLELLIDRQGRLQTLQIKVAPADQAAQ